VNVQNLKAKIFTTEKLKYVFFFYIKHKQTIYSFQRLVKTFNRGAYLVKKTFKAHSTNKTEVC